MGRAIAAVLFAIGTCACSEPLEFAEWTIPVPEGTRIVEHAHVPDEERSARIELVEEIVLGGSEVDPAQVFYGLRGIAVGSQGWIYVLDGGNSRVQVFDRSGALRMSVGGRGQGPGELMVPRSMAVAEDTLAITDVINNRWQSWDESGGLISAVSLFERILDVDGLEDGSFVGSFYDDVESPTHMSVVRVSPSGDVLERYLDWEPRVTNAPWDIRARPGIAVHPSGRLYVYGGDRYQLLAMDASNEPVWALRTDWLAPPVSEEIIEGILDVWRGFDPAPASGLNRSEWPAVIPQPALRDVEVDGHGHVYVFPYVYIDTRSSPPERFPVDVYSPDGTALFAGTIAVDPITGWMAASGDDIYVLSEEAGSHEPVVVRYRLVEPFD